ncbi:hypothetical protein ES332_A02G151600v1 [Gossypium tomentosum]|uniref:Uncharacterized protein n=1 Tax=Gossypium tomentosum TaxID=34277 RepID=A0A5D2RHM8_GOSTO|nr:hypothetical protein ES332_A02G151600v1 [Gossypium tomentosum]
MDLVCRVAYPMFLPNNFITTVCSISFMSIWLIRSNKAGIPLTEDLTISPSRISRSSSSSSLDDGSAFSSPLKPVPMRRSFQDLGLSGAETASMATSALPS